jgi:Tol biopolymer transport system component
LTRDRAADSEPAWSPDGARVAFVSTRDRNAEIYAMNADGSGVTRLTRDRAIDSAPAW